MNEWPIGLGADLPRTLANRALLAFFAPSNWSHLGLRARGAELATRLGFRTLRHACLRLGLILGGRGRASRIAHGALSARSLDDRWQDDRLLGRLGRFDLFVRKELRLHLVSVNVAQMMENILSKITRDLLCSSKAAHHLLSFVKAIVAPERLTLTLCILLEQQR